MTVAFIHASRAAIEPVANYYTAHAPDLDCVHLLDDGIMRFLAAQDAVRSERRFHAMVETARDTYGASLIVLTCSAVPRETMDALRIAAGIPLFKIDEPMAQLAAACGKRIGVLATFPATLATTRSLLEEAEPGIAVVWELEENALKALLAGERDTSTVLREADLALYRAKAIGRGSVEHYSDSMGAEFLRRTQIESALREPGVEHDIELLYQPILNLRTMRIESFEALARWTHSSLGPIAPSDFIPITEQMQLVDTSGIAPLSHPIATIEPNLSLRLRDDVITEKNQREAYQQCAPATQDGLYLVPKVID